MSDHPVLGQVALGYSPMIDKHRAVTALRLTVFPIRPDARIDAAVAALRPWPQLAPTALLLGLCEVLQAQVAGLQRPA